MNALCEPGNDTDDIQFTVKGSSAPAPSFAVDFYRAARLCFVDIVITRPGYDPIRLTRFHGNFEEENDNRVIFLDLTADGAHFITSTLRSLHGGASPTKTADLRMTTHPTSWPMWSPTRGWTTATPRRSPAVTGQTTTTSWRHALPSTTS